MILNHQKFDFQKKCLIEKITIKAPLRMKSEFQNEACFIYFKEGKTQFSLPTERLEINSHESILINCGIHFADFMQSATAETCELYAVHLYPDLLKEIYKNEIPTFIKESKTKQSKTKQFAEKLGTQNVIDHFINSLTFYFENPKLVTDELLVLKLKELILLLTQTNNSKSLIELFSKIFAPRQANINDIIQAHLYSNFSVSELASLANRSISAFKREFQILFSDAPANFFKEKKMEKSENLLKYSDYSVSEICFQIGFNDTSYFTRAFKKRNKLSPLAYRKANKEHQLKSWTKSPVF